MEQTFILVKPDGVKRRKVGKIISRLEEKGFVLSAIKSVVPDRSLVGTHYKEHVAKSWYKSVLDYFTSGMVVAMVWSGHNVISECRRMIGATNPLEAEMGTIRGDYGVDLGRNVVHGSDSPESASREIELWFGKVDPSEKCFDYELLYEK
jgi:nucleoside-diphosphate kinase